MANPVSIYNWRRDTGGTASITGTASASYVRSGSKITVTVTVKITDGWGKYWNVQVAGTGVISEEIGTATKTYTYNTTSAQTYSYAITSYIQTATSYAGESMNHGTLTIDVPAASALPYVNVNGTWKQATPWVNVGGTWKKVISYVNAGGTWKY